MFAFVGAPDVNEIRSVKRAFQLLGHPLVRYHSDLPHSPRLALRQPPFYVISCKGSLVFNP